MSLPSHEFARRRDRVVRLVRPAQQFIETETSGGIALIVAAVIALIWANSPWAESYRALIHEHLVLDIGFFRVDESLHFWINDAAMVLFFFLVGLEIKREAAVGELASIRRVAVPMAAALGGMIAPVLIFLAITQDPAARGGWGIPMATDIAFAVGVLALLGPRIPTGLKVLLLAMAIIDDIGAILVIAVFYTSDLSFLPLGLAFGMLALAWVFRQVGIWYIPLYFVLGIVAWAAVLESGVHPTTVGVAFGLLTPWRSWYRPEAFVQMAGPMIARLGRSPGGNGRAGGEVVELREAPAGDDDAALYQDGHEDRETLITLGALSQATVAPLDRLEHELHPLVAFGILPVFAFVNAGVALSGGALSEAAGSALTWGVLLGLLIGKPLGVLAGVFTAVKLGAELPAGVRWSSLLGMGLIAGIGFTVALFITELAFTEAALLNQAKLGILGASLISGLAGYLMLRTRAPIHGHLVEETAEAREATRTH